MLRLKTLMRTRAHLHNILLFFFGISLAINAQASILAHVYVPMKGKISYPTGSLPKLHVDGRYVKDEYNNIVHLRGVNKPGLQYSWEWLKDGEFRDGIPNENPYGKPGAMTQHIDGMADWGVNLLRLNIAGKTYMQGYPSDPPSIEDRDLYRNVIRQIIDYAELKGIYTIIDCHTWDQSDSVKFPPDVDAWIAFWEQVAMDYLGRTSVIFGLLNEPYNKDHAVWQETTQRCVDAIKAIDPDRIISVMGAEGEGTLTWVRDYPITGTNIIYEVHMYMREQWLITQRPTEYEALKQWLVSRDWRYVMDTLHKPILVGEVGLWTTEDDEGNQTRFFTVMLRIMNEWTIPYLGWAWVAEANQACRLLDAYPSTPNYAGNYLISGLRGEL